MLFTIILFSNIISSTDKPTKELFSICKGSHVEYECSLTEIFKPKNENGLNLFVSDHNIVLSIYYSLEHKWFLPANTRIKLNDKVYTVKDRKEIKMKQGVFKVPENAEIYTKIIPIEFLSYDNYKIKGYCLYKGDDEKTIETEVWYDKNLTEKYFMRLNYKKDKTFLVFNGEFTVDQKDLDELAFSDFFSFKSTGDLKEKRFTFVGEHENDFPLMKKPFLIVPKNTLLNFLNKFKVLPDDKIMNNTSRLECIEGVKAYFIDDIANVFMLEGDKIVKENTAKIDALNVEMKKLDNLLNAEKQKTTQFNDQISALNKNITNLNEKIKIQADELTKAMAGSDHAKQDAMRKIIDEKNRLETELVAAKTKYAQQEIDLNIVTAKKNELEQQLVQLTNENSNMKAGKFTEINAQKEEIDDLRKKLQDKSKKVSTTAQQPLTKKGEKLLSRLSGTDLFEGNAQKEMSGREKTAWVLFGMISAILVAFICAIFVWFTKYKNEKDKNIEN